MEIFQTLTFRQSYKKLYPNVRSVVNEQIQHIVENPNIGEEKKQDLQGVFVHKFKVHTQLYLLAYTFDTTSLTLLNLGVHENFYRDLKRK
jgi:mRNA-degrading endonuclease RelE of RelBE toxin-antitoxin system